MMNFIKVASCCPVTNVANPIANMVNIKECINKAVEEQCKIAIFPELSLTSYTCADLFFQKQLLESSMNELKCLCEFSRDKDIFISVGGPLEYEDTLYNVAFNIFKGKILGIVPKIYIPNYSEFYEKRWFTSGVDIKNKVINLDFQKEIPFGSNLIFSCDNIKIGVEICEDLWSVIPPSSILSLNGANILCNLSSSNELVSKSEYRKDLIINQSARCLAAYIYSSSGVFESTTDLLFSGHLLISENGTVIAENKRFQRENEIITAIVDVDKINNDRVKNVTFRDGKVYHHTECEYINFSFDSTEISNFDRFIEKHPFVPSNEKLRDQRCKEIFSIQSSALAKRFCHTGLKKAVIGISGGLDSTLALLVTAKTFDMLNIPRKNIVTVTMPGFGTTDRTYTNALELCKNLGTDLREINIVEASLLHFKDIGHPKELLDVTYENVQARERTQILMDLANKEGGLLIGTGDLSELAIGWCTYNGDHMSMYAVNCSVPKTLVRYLVKYVADKESTKVVTDILLDILDTPVSPELLPKDKSGNISQKTEDIIGPYELHDFFLYHLMKGEAPKKILFMANAAFKNIYEIDFIEKWLKIFLKRFFASQFKRSCIPDGPKVGSISLSPRGDLRMPTDGEVDIWLSSLSK